LSLDFPEFKTDGSEDFISPAISLDPIKRPGQIAFGLSILAQRAQILLTGDVDWRNKPGILINLETNGVEWIAPCTAVAKDNIKCTRVKESNLLYYNRYTYYFNLFFF
jgi:hypothetical protein